MQRLEVSGVVRPIYGSLGVKRLMIQYNCKSINNTIISNNYGKSKTLFCSSQFSRARERISSKFIENLGTRPQKICQPYPIHTQLNSCTASYC